MPPLSQPMWLRIQSPEETRWFIWSHLGTPFLRQGVKHWCPELEPWISLEWILKIVTWFLGWPIKDYFTQCSGNNIHIIDNRNWELEEIIFNSINLFPNTSFHEEIYSIYIIGQNFSFTWECKSPGIAVSKTEIWKWMMCEPILFLVFFLKKWAIIYIKSDFTLKKIVFFSYLWGRRPEKETLA